MATPKRVSSFERRATKDSSPFDVDIGGGQREELRRQLESTEAELAKLQESAARKDTQLALLVKLKKQGEASERVGSWKRAVLSPVFHAWARLGAVEQVAKRNEAVATAQAALTQEKEQQVAALCDRVARIKSNAQSKLSELSEANKRMAAALEAKDKALLDAEARAKHLQRTSSAQGEREVELQLQLEQAQDELRTARRDAEEGQAVTVAAEAAREAAAEDACAARGEMARARAAAVEALAAAQDEAREARTRLAEAQAHVGRMDARAGGLEAEVACLKAEAKASLFLVPPAIQEVLAAWGVGGGGGGGHELVSVTSSPCLQLGSWRRAVMALALHAWQALVRYRAELRRDRLKHALVVTLPPSVPLPPPGPLAALPLAVPLPPPDAPKKSPRRTSKPRPTLLVRRPERHCGALGPPPYPRAARATLCR